MNMNTFTSASDEDIYGDYSVHNEGHMKGTFDQTNFGCKSGEFINSGVIDGDVTQNNFGKNC